MARAQEHSIANLPKNVLQRIITICSIGEALKTARSRSRICRPIGLPLALVNRRFRALVSETLYRSVVLTRTDELRGLNEFTVKLFWVLAPSVERLYLIGSDRKASELAVCTLFEKLLKCAPALSELHLHTPMRDGECTMLQVLLRNVQGTLRALTIRASRTTLGAVICARLHHLRYLRVEGVTDKAFTPLCTILMSLRVPRMNIARLRTLSLQFRRRPRHRWFTPMCQISSLVPELERIELIGFPAETWETRKVYANMRLAVTVPHLINSFAKARTLLLSNFFFDFYTMRRIQKSCEMINLDDVFMKECYLLGSLPERGLVAHFPYARRYTEHPSSMIWTKKLKGYGLLNYKWCNCLFSCACWSPYVLQQEFPTLKHMSWHSRADMKPELVLNLFAAFRKTLVSLTIVGCPGINSSTLASAICRTERLKILSMEDAVLPVHSVKQIVAQIGYRLQELILGILSHEDTQSPKDTGEEYLSQFIDFVARNCPRLYKVDFLKREVMYYQCGWSEESWERILEALTRLFTNAKNLCARDLITPRHIALEELHWMSPCKRIFLDDTAQQE